MLFWQLDMNFGAYNWTNLKCSILQKLQNEDSQRVKVNEDENAKDEDETLGYFSCIDSI